MSPVRVVVVGAGVVGLLTALECVRAGAEVSLLDQAEIPSPAATSYDRHRVVRALHRGDPGLTRAAAHAHHGWLDVERAVGARFYHWTGALTAMPPAEVPVELARLTAAAVPARAVGPEELSRRYPRIRVPAGLAAVFEPAAGVVLADRALPVLARWLRDQPGVRLLPGRRVIGLGPDAAVQLADGTAVAGDRVVVAAGPWSRELLPVELAGELTLYRQSMLSYAPRPTRQAWEGTPAIPAIGAPGGAWLIPPVADTPVRLSAPSACRPVPEMTDRATSDAWRTHLVERFSGLLTDFDPAAVVEAKDGYYLADTATGGPVLFGLGGSTWVYAACGGLSFKFAPLIARALADRVTAGRAAADRAPGRRPRRTGIDPIDRPRRVAARREEFA